MHDGLQGLPGNAFQVLGLQKVEILWSLETAQLRMKERAKISVKRKIM